jgi:hypothetical protein
MGFGPSRPAAGPHKRAVGLGIGLWPDGLDDGGAET